MFASRVSSSNLRVFCAGSGLKAVDRDSGAGLVLWRSSRFFWKVFLFGTRLLSLAEPCVLVLVLCEQPRVAGSAAPAVNPPVPPQTLTKTLSRVAFGCFSASAGSHVGAAGHHFIGVCLCVSVCVSEWLAGHC